MTAPAMSPATPTQPRGSVLAYTRFILRDYLMNQGVGTAVVLLLFGVATVAPLMTMMGDNFVMGEVPEPGAGQLLGRMADSLSFLGALFATNGIVAGDRRHGYYKFLFAKPVRPWRYYAAMFAIHGLGLLLVTVALALLWGRVVRPALSVELLAIVALAYVAYGGLGFLLSASWRYDWLSLVSVVVVANIGWSVWGPVDGWRHWVLYLLPPVQRDDAVFALLASTGGPIPWLSIAWLGGYGLLCFVLGLVVIHKRPLGTS